jgi:hypothetical protein
LTKEIEDEMMLRHQLTKQTSANPIFEDQHIKIALDSKGNQNLILKERSNP